MKAYLKALFFILICLGVGPVIGQWFIYVWEMQFGGFVSFWVAMGPIALLAAIPFRRAFADRKEKH